jgi:opacity protein-like surface antigen
MNWPIHKLLLLTLLIAAASLSASTALAQDEPKIEITPFVGYTFSEGVKIQPQDIGQGREVDRLGPTSAFSYGFDLDVLFGEHFAFGFLYSEERSQLEARIVGDQKQTYTDMPVRNYHGIFTYNLGDSDAQLRPFFLIGLGATNYSPGDIDGQSVSGDTRFSTTWGGGVKFFPRKNVGVRFMGRLTPTYITSEASGLWCSPIWPWSCWVVGNPEYSHQFEMSGGVVLRF